MIRTVSIPTGSRPGYYDPDFRKKIVLADGGVYDNLALERAWKHNKTILVSDGGGLLEAEADPAEDWLGMTNRVLSVIYNQVRALRKRAVIEFFSSRSATVVGALARYSELPITDCPGVPDRRHH